MDDPMGEACKPITAADRKLFKGFVEVESDPALFEYILQKNGVEGVRIQELYDVANIATESDGGKVHGLVFLFPYDAIDAVESDDDPKCPQHVWFANQVVDNACATVALLNIIMNCPEVKLGSHLNHFKKSTRRLKPPYRGRQIGNNEFIRTNHNSFMRRMEMLNADLVMSNQYEKFSKTRNSKKVTKGSKVTSIKPRKKRVKVEHDEAYHYIAYVPVLTDVWRLDGLLKQPTKIGPCGDNWLSVARDNMATRIAQDGKSQYNLMALCEDPILPVRKELAKLLKSINEVEKSLDDIMEDWKAFGNFKTGSSKQDVMASCDIDQTMVDDAQLTDATKEVLMNGAPSELLDSRKTLAKEWARLEGEYMQEVSNGAEKSEIVARRLEDPTSAIIRSLKELSEKGLLKGIAQKVVDEGSRGSSASSLR